MSDWQRVQRASLGIAGSLILLIGIGHIFMPSLGYTEIATQGMTEQAKEHFYFLGTYAICTFLLAFGALTLSHALNPKEMHTLIFSAILSIVWLIRLALQFAYPVQVPIFGLEHPHPILVPVLSVIAAAFVIATIAGILVSHERRKASNKENPGADSA